MFSRLIKVQQALGLSPGSVSAMLLQNLLAVQDGQPRQYRTEDRIFTNCWQAHPKLVALVYNRQNAGVRKVGRQSMMQHKPSQLPDAQCSALSQNRHSLPC